MNRTQKLILDWIDGKLPAQEAEELERLLDMPAVRAEHRALCEIEYALRCRREGFDLSDRIMRTLNSMPEDARSSGKDADIPDSAAAIFPETPQASAAAPGRSDPAGVRRFSPASRFVRLAAACVAVASLVWAVWMWTSGMHGLPLASGARLLHVEGDVRVTTAGRERKALSPQTLSPGAHVVAAADSLAVATLGDGSRITLHGGSRLSLPAIPSPDGLAGPPPGFHLQRGTVTAHVPKRMEGQELNISTPAAGITVLGTRFILAAEEAATRLDVIQGAVRLRRRLDSTSVDVPWNSYAVADLGAEEAMAVRQAAPRTSDGLLALYTFGDADENLVRDVSGVEPPLDLTVVTPEAVDWPSGGGILLRDAALLASAEPAAKITAACRESGGITLEAWLTPSTLRQWGPARIVTISQGPSYRNITLGMGGYGDPGAAGGGRYLGRIRTTVLGLNGLPPLETAPGSAPPGLTHLVLTRAPDGTTRIYLDAVVRAAGMTPGDLHTWDENYRLALGNEFGSDRKWFGTLHLVALYGRALNAEEVSINFRAGPRYGS